jgi:protein-L-isoaspartate(D-aspartate) O-methyltransferase
VSTSGLAAIRRRYAASMTADVPGDTAALAAAFAAVPREDFLGPPPWMLAGGGSYPHGTEDPAELYQDVLVALDAAKGINNGSPSLHAHMLHLLAPAPGDAVLHVGAGTGYYSAILAELVGATGRVTAVEYEAPLAAAAARNLRPWAQATAVHGDGADWPQGPVRRIYINFGLSDLADRWLDLLEVGGTLVCPLGVPDRWRPHVSGYCRVFVLTRTARGYAARFSTPVAFVFAEGPTAGDAALHAALGDAFMRGGEERVCSLIRGPADPARCWMTSARFSLGLDPP